MTPSTSPIYDREIRVARLTVPGTTTRAYTWHPSVASAIVAAFQQRNADRQSTDPTRPDWLPDLPGVRKMRWWIHRPTATWRVQVAATPEGHEAVSTAVRAICKREGLAHAADTSVA